MTRERLQTLSITSLEEIAGREGIKLIAGIDRETLIDQILEAMQEDRDEREETNNNAIRIEEKKFEIIRDEELESQERKDFCIPERYNETRIVLLVRDPHWAFAYWDLNEKHVNEIKRKPGVESMFLRVFQIEDVPDGREIVDCFEIPIKITDDRWYINLPQPGGRYYIELIGVLDGREKIYSRSNLIESPRGMVFSGPSSEIEDNEKDPILELSGMGEFGISSLFRQNPQRIMTEIETKYSN